MRTFITMSILTITILISWIGVDTLKQSGTRVYDDEQEGLEDQIIIRFSHVVAENTPKGLAAQKFAELVHQETNGKVKVEVYPNGILYSDGEEVDALVSGDIQMIAPTFTKMTEYVPEWKVLDLPFLFENDAHVERIFTGNVGQDLIQQVDESHMKGMTFWSNGFKQMTSNKKPLLIPSDFEQQRFRVMNGEVLSRQFQLLQAMPDTQPFNNVYHSLEVNEVDGQENTISNIYSKGLYKVQSHLTLSNHGYLGYAVIMNNDFWKTLSPQQQIQVTRALEKTTKWIHKEAKIMNDTQLEEIQNHSTIQIHTLTNEQKKLWEDRFSPLYKEVESEIGSELLTRIEQARP